MWVLDTDVSQDSTALFTSLINWTCAGSDHTNSLMPEALCTIIKKKKLAKYSWICPYLVVLTVQYCIAYKAPPTLRQTHCISWSYYLVIVSYQHRYPGCRDLRETRNTVAVGKCLSDKNIISNKWDYIANKACSWCPELGGRNLSQQGFLPESQLKTKKG